MTSHTANILRRDGGTSATNSATSLDSSASVRIVTCVASTHCASKHSTASATAAPSKSRVQLADKARAMVCASNEHQLAVAATGSSRTDEKNSPLPVASGRRRAGSPSKRHWQYRRPPAAAARSCCRATGHQVHDSASGFNLAAPELRGRAPSAHTHARTCASLK
jgi:hypothetical protein